MDKTHFGFNKRTEKIGLLNRITPLLAGKPQVNETRVTGSLEGRDNRAIKKRGRV